MWEALSAKGRGGGVGPGPPHVQTYANSGHVDRGPLSFVHSGLDHGYGDMVQVDLRTDKAVKLVRSQWEILSQGKLDS